MENPIVNNLLERCVREKIINQKQAFALIKKIPMTQTSCIDHLFNEKTINSQALAQLLSQFLNIPFIDIKNVSLSQMPVNLFDKALLRKHAFLPLSYTGNLLVVGLADPTDHLILQEIRFYTGFIIKIVIVDREILYIQRKKILLNKQNLQLESFVKKQTNSQGVKNDTALTLEQNESLELGTDNELMVIQLVYKVLHHAIDRGASDIHYEPELNQLHVRFRIDGLLYSMVNYPPHLTARITTRLKVMAQLDIAESRIPQDGRFQVTHLNGQVINCRLNTCPTLYGEKSVVRLLDNKKIVFDINSLGMNNIQKIKLYEALRSPQGLILVTGPTGSGKTITLYTLLSYLNKPNLNISSVENPIEIALPGINQVNINSKAGLTFATVLRALLRQDPDILFVGEMRDQETAEIGIKAAQTGHLVFSGLHTNNTAESVIRLMNMGIPRYNLAASITLVIAQRLVRCLCSNCKIQENLPQSILKELEINPNQMQGARWFKAKGCQECFEGYKGRVGIFELLTIDNEIRNYILKKTSAEKIISYAKNQGMQTLHDSAIEKLKQGQTSLIEMRRVIKDE